VLLAEQPKLTPKKMSKVGVFDSGIGGKSVAIAIEKAMPETQVVYANDSQHVPYGDKTPAQLLEFVTPILQGLVDQGCQVLVIACNSVTTTIISELRQRIAVPLIGIEPMVRPAARLTKTGVIAVCATPLTLGSPRYAWLKKTYAPHVKIVEPDCSQWAYMIEQNQFNKESIQHQIDELCDAGADVIVLGCTHYHWIEKEITALAAGRAIVIQPEKAVILQLKRVLKQLVG
jgi:glutamate racemase